MTGAVFGALERALPPPLNFAIGLAVFQVFFIPTGIMYWLASRTSPEDIDTVQEMLNERAEEVAAHPRRPRRRLVDQVDPVFEDRLTGITP